MRITEAATWTRCAIPTGNPVAMATSWTAIATIATADTARIAHVPASKAPAATRTSPCPASDEVSVCARWLKDAPASSWARH